MHEIHLRPENAHVNADASVRREYFSHPTIRRAQKVHFITLDLLPWVIAFGSISFFRAQGIHAVHFILFAAFYVISLIGIEVGYHRLFSHSSFLAKPVLRGALLICGAMAGQGPVIAWASNHRHHHKYSDQKGDTHSPWSVPLNRQSRLMRFMHAHLLWKWDYAYPNPAYYSRALIREELLNRLDHHYYAWVLLGMILPGAIAGWADHSWSSALTGLLFSGVIRVLFGQQVTWCINSVCHLAGGKRFKTRDESRNLPALTFLTCGGSLHNNHHAFPNRPNNSRAWHELDPGYWIILAWKKLGWAE